MKTFALIVWIALATAAGYALFNVTFRVEKLEAELSELNHQIITDQQAIHILKAEWSYLDRPERLEALVYKFLPHLKSNTVPPILNFENLPRSEAIDAYIPKAAHNSDDFRTMKVKH